MSTLHKRMQRPTSASEDEVSNIENEIVAKRQKSVKRNVFQSKKPNIEEISDSEESYSCADTESSIGSVISADGDPSEANDDDKKEINIGDYVLIKEGVSKGLEVMSIGYVNNKTETTVNVTYIRRLFPKFIFVPADLDYVFDISQVFMKLPAPKPSGQTARISEMLVFPVDFQAYYNVLK